MPLDLVERMLNCLAEAEHQGNPQPILDGLIDVKNAYTGSGYSASSFVENKGIDTATDNMMFYKRMQIDGKERDCVAVHLTDMMNPESAAKILAEIANLKLPDYVVDMQKGIVAIILV